MAKSVAILDGDSSGLVRSMDTAKGSMQKLDAEGKKLTDQLRDVADEADKAAGALVNKIGGPTAIKAMAGVGAAFAGASTALGVLSSSMTAFYTTQGAEGAKAMADIDAAMANMTSKLFEAVMGTDDLEKATQTLITGINVLTDVVELILTPISELMKFIRMISELGDQGATSAIKHARELAKFKDVQDTVKISYENVAEAIAKNKLNVMGLTGATDDLARAQIRQQMAIVNGLADAAKAAEATREEAEIGLEVLKKKADNYAEAVRTANMSGTNLTGEEHAAIVSSVYAGLTQATINSARAARVGYSAETTQLLKDAGADYEALQRLLFAVGQTAEETTAKVQTGRSGGGGARKAGGQPVVVEETPEAKMFREMSEYMDKARKEQAEASAKTYADGLAAEVAAFRDAEAEKERIKTENLEKDRLTEQAGVDAKKDMYQDLFQVKAKLLVQEMTAGKNGLKVMRDMAKKAIGDAIMAKGDEAMAQAAMFAATLNPMAVPMAAAGAAAYAAAAALGSSSKKATTSTPAAAAPAQQMNTNVSYNLQIDAAFVNGESVARQFAMAQREAQRRGMMPAGAF